LRVTLAVDRDFADANGNRQADFVNIVVWGAAAEACAKYLGKGKLAAVDGRLQQRNYTDKNGAARYVTEVIAEKVRFLSPKDSGAANNSAPAAATPAADAPQYGYYMGGECAEDDLPF
jgi:single-strand DNA-binding protein